MAPNNELMILARFENVMADPLVAQLIANQKQLQLITLQHFHQIAL
jgi:hypothetical protein